MEDEVEKKRLPGGRICVCMSQGEADWRESKEAQKHCLSTSDTPTAGVAFQVVLHVLPEQIQHNLSA